MDIKARSTGSIANFSYPKPIGSGQPEFATAPARVRAGAALLKILPMSVVYGAVTDVRPLGAISYDVVKRLAL